MEFPFDTQTLFIIGLALVIFGNGTLVFLLYRHSRAMRQRREAIGHRAMALRARYEEKGDAALVEEIGRLEPRQHKRHEQIFNVVRGERDGQPYELMDYLFVTGSGKSSTRHPRTLLRYRLEARVPDFELRAEGVLDRIGAWLGWHDIDFPHRPDFSRRYNLDGADESAIRAFFHDRVINVFEAEQDAFVVIGCGGDSLLIYRPVGRWEKVEELEAFLDNALAIAGSFRPR